MISCISVKDNGCVLICFFLQTSSWLRRHSRELSRKVSRDFALLGGFSNGGEAASSAHTEHHNKRRAHAREAR